MNTGGSKIVTPEEKLLRIIRGKPAPGAGAGTEAAPAASAAAAAGPRRAWGIPGWLISGANIVLGCVIAGEVAMLMFTMASPEPPTIPPPTAGVERVDAPPVEAPTPSLAAMASRPIFAVAETRSAPSPSGQAAAKGPSAEAKQLATRLSLIGVVMGDVPQAIIQDSQSGKTFFVTSGQAVIEGIVVESVAENRVVLDLDGEKIPLSL